MIVTNTTHHSTNQCAFLNLVRKVLSCCRMNSNRIIHWASITCDMVKKRGLELLGLSLFQPSMNSYLWGLTPLPTPTDTNLKTLLKIVTAACLHPLVIWLWKCTQAPGSEKRPSKQETKFTKELTPMEMSSWTREQSKTLFLKQAQWTHMMKFTAEHSHAPKSPFTTSSKQLPSFNRIFSGTP